MLLTTSEMCLRKIINKEYNFINFSETRTKEFSDTFNMHNFYAIHHGLIDDNMKRVFDI